MVHVTGNLDNPDDEPLETVDSEGAASPPDVASRGAGPASTGGGRVVRREAGSVCKATGADNDGRFEMLVLDVEHRGGPPLHTHEVQEDSFFVLDGVLTVQMADEVVALYPGDFATVPPGVPHTFTNTDPDRAARVLNIMTPGIGFDRYIAAAMSGTGEAEMERLGEEYGVTMVGPSLPEKLGLR